MEIGITGRKNLITLKKQKYLEKIKIKKLHYVMLPKINSNGWQEWKKKLQWDF